ncbi:MAG: hypothetical protein P8O23_07740 [Opitutales bacterium]|nr:hypothetical protein [Opitutales bacterium]
MRKYEDRSPRMESYVKGLYTHENGCNRAHIGEGKTEVTSDRDAKVSSDGVSTSTT